VKPANPALAVKSINLPSLQYKINNKISIYVFLILATGAKSA
jgi:hypothetical protein